MLDQKDDALIQAFLHGSRDAIGILLQRYQRSLYFLCLRMVEDHEDALELVQKTFINVMEKLGTLQNHAAFKTWVYKICINLCYNLLREKNNYNRALTNLPALYNAKVCWNDYLEKEEQRSIIQNCLQELSEKQRTVVILRVYQGLSYQEISEVLGCQEATVRSHFHLGLKKLAVKLKHFIE